MLEALAEVRTLHPSARWLPPNKLHLTIVFLGQTDVSRVDSIATVMGEVAAGHRPFDVAAGEAGGRIGGRGGGVAWMRLANGGHDLAQLALDVDAALGSATFNEKFAPRPHLTVARGVSEEALADLRAVAAGMTLGWTVNRLVLFRSHTDPGGSRYEELTSASVGA